MPSRSKTRARAGSADRGTVQLSAPCCLRRRRATASREGVEPASFGDTVAAANARLCPKTQRPPSFGFHAVAASARFHTSESSVRPGPAGRISTGISRPERGVPAGAVAELRDGADENSGGVCRVPQGAGGVPLVDAAKEAALFRDNEPLLRGEAEVGGACGIRAQPRAIGLVVRKALEGDQPE